MKLGRDGEAFFVEPTDENLEDELMTSPITSPPFSPNIAP